MALTINKKEEVNSIGCNWTSESKRGNKLGPLQRELANSYYWSGTFSTDFRFFIYNWHPLLGIFLCHPAHPWTKRDRLATFAFSICCSMVPIAVQLQGGTNRELKDRNVVAFGKLFFIVSLPLMLWEVCLYWINVMDMYCIGRCHLLAACSRVFQSCFLFISLVGGALCACTAIGAIMPYADEPMWKFALLTMLSRMQMWVAWFPIYTFLPCIGFRPVWLQEKRARQCLVASSEPAPTLCDVCGRARFEHHDKKFCTRASLEVATVQISADCFTNSCTVQGRTLCEVCGKTRLEHPNNKFCRRATRTGLCVSGIIIAPEEDELPTPQQEYCVNGIILEGDGHLSPPGIIGGRDEMQPLTPQGCCVIGIPVE